MNSFSDFIQQVEPLIELELEKFVANLQVVEPLQNAVSYALFPKGKRIRPLLALAICRDLGADATEFVQPALALELLHASSLIHDDLPALDNDDFRRGRPSCHKQFGEATAILAGDLLVSAAFLLASSTSIPVPQITALLAQAFIDVCHGQQRDLLQGPARGPLDMLHQLKTGSLFRAALQLGALISNAGVPVVERSALFGEKLGIYFQIIDDLLDLKGNEEKKGRPVSSDLRNQRETFGLGYNAGQLEEQLSQIKKEIDVLLGEIESGAKCRLILIRHLFGQVSSTVPVHWTET